MSLAIYSFSMSMLRSEMYIAGNTITSGLTKANKDGSVCFTDRSLSPHKGRIMILVAFLLCLLIGNSPELALTRYRGAGAR
jgi:hypothetical protein